MADAPPPEPRSRLSRLVVVVAVLAAVVGIGVGVALHATIGSASARTAPRIPALHGQAVWPSGKLAAPDFALRDQQGRLVSLRSQRHRTVVIAFMDSHCHQVCPLEGRTLAAAVSQLQARSRPVLLAVSVNPWQDTARSARRAAQKWGFTGRWHWLLGSRAELAPVWRAYRIYVKRAKGDIVHSDAIYVVDRHGFERAGFIYPFLAAPVAQDLRVLAGSQAA